MEPFTLRMMQRARAQKLDENSNYWIAEKRTKIFQAINRDVVSKPGCMEEISSLHQALLNLSYSVNDSSMEAQDIFTVSNKDHQQNIFSYVEIDMETVAVDKDYLGSMSSNSSSASDQEILQQTIENSINISESGEYRHSSCEPERSFVKNDTCSSGEEQLRESESSFVKDEISCSGEDQLRENEATSNDIYNTPLNECEISRQSYFSCNEPLYEVLRDPSDSSIEDDSPEFQNIYYRCPQNATQTAFANLPRTSGLRENAESIITPETQYVMDRFLKDALGDENLFSSENEESCSFSPVPSTEKEEIYHTVSDYRKLLRLSRQKIRSPLSKSSFLVQDASRATQNPEEKREKTLQNLFQQIATQRKILDQAKKARDLCYQSRRFRNSAVVVDCERIILLTCNKIQALITEIDAVKMQETTGASSHEEGQLTVTEITLVLQDEHAKRKAERDSIWYVCLLSHHDTVLATPARSKIRNMRITFQGNYTFSHLTNDFVIDVKVYSYCHKPHGWSSSLRRLTCFQRTGFSLEGTSQIALSNLKNNFWNLKNIPPTSTLARVLTMTFTCSVCSKIAVSGFLNYCLETEGPKMWDRKWFFLDGHVLKFWNSPLDQESKVPEGSIDILSCIDEEIKQTDRCSCARPWTFLIQTENRHFLEANSKWEMTEWCSFLNEVLAIHKAWHIA